MQIRMATKADAEAIAEIYNDAVLNTTAIWNDDIVSIENRVAWMTDRQKAGFPVLVAEDDEGTVAGYASYGPWRAFDGYRHTVEHSVYVQTGRRGQGVGRTLMLALISEARIAGIHAMIAGIEANNTASIALHHRLGFKEAGLLREVGTKFGKWLDLAFLQLNFDESGKS